MYKGYCHAYIKYYEVYDRFRNFKSYYYAPYLSAQILVNWKASVDKSRNPEKKHKLNSCSVVEFVNYVCRRFNLFYHTPKLFFNSFDAYAPHVIARTPTRGTDYMATVSCMRQYGVEKPRFPCVNHQSVWVTPMLSALVAPIDTPAKIDLPFSIIGFKVKEVFVPAWHAGVHLTRDLIPDDGLLRSFNDASFRAMPDEVLPCVNAAKPRPHADIFTIRKKHTKILSVQLGFASESKPNAYAPKFEAPVAYTE